ncbi:MAG: discoidin domain-containing protein, partial [Oxalobacteraceae bacterium]
PTAPTTGSPFEFVANISASEGTADYNIEGLAVGDASGNLQFWGTNGGGSGRSGAACASYSIAGDWSDGDFRDGSASDGSWFRIIADDTTMKLYRSTDGQSWVLKYTYTGRGFGTITRYGFMVHRYGFGSGTGDTLKVASAYSTEFPKAVTGPGKAYWRIYMPPGSGYFAYCINQLDFLDASGVVIPTTGAIFSARTVDGTHVAASAFDNDDSTFYSSATFGSYETGTASEWLAVQFTGPVSVAAIRIKSRAGTAGETKQVPALFLLQYSSDGGVWRTLAEFGSTEFISGVARVFPVND